MPKPDTIVLIHGLFMTALSWEKWVERYSSKGFRVTSIIHRKVNFLKPFFWGFR